MRQLIIRTKQFCSLAREQKWQDWLEKHAPDLLEGLLRHLSQSKGCKANSEKMMQLYNTLRRRGLQDSAVHFLKREYPAVIEETGGRVVKGQPSKLLERVANREVFPYYNPHVLTFPQRLVMQNGDREQLLKDVKAFIVPMVDSDYLIVGEFAFIEYFKQKYASEAKQVPKEKRLLHKFRLLKNMSPSEKIFSEEEK